MRRRQVSTFVRRCTTATIRLVSGRGRCHQAARWPGHRLGTPADWASSAKDALRLLGFTGKTDWSLERTLYRLEAYNGFGYRRMGVPTPY